MTLGTLIPSGAPRTHSARYEQVLGTSLDLLWISSAWWSSRLGSRIEEAALAEIRRLDVVFSTFRPDSELTRWMGTLQENVPISAELAEVLESAAAWRLKTFGAFDPIYAEGPPDLAPLWEVFRPAEGEAPSARKLTPSKVSLDAIAKGYIVDRACSAAAGVAGDTDVVLNLGGDVRHLGTRPIRVGVTDPSSDAENSACLEHVSICNQGMATSGSYRRGMRDERGEWKSHLIDPRSGGPVDHVVSASVIAPSTTTADVLATAFSVLQPRESLAIADSIPRVGCLLIRADGARVANSVWDQHVITDQAERPISRRRMVAGLCALGFGWTAAPRGAGARSLPRSIRPGTEQGSSRRAQLPWDERFELAITFSIGDARGGMQARRPYVVVYIDDEEGNPVRTVSLWAQDASWIRNLRRWYRSERARQAEYGVGLVSTVTSPTRSPGRYTVIWDGRDDQGELVAQGEYFVCLETIRQGGSDYFTREPITLESTPFVAQMEAYGTFREIELDFRERS